MLRGKHGGNKQGGRGGRGGSSGGASFGAYGRIFHKKKKSKGRSNTHRGLGPDYPELADLESSMKTLSRRPGRLIDEVEYTLKHQDETLGKALRNRPIEFVKAKEVYDPSAELFKKMVKSENKEELETPPVPNEVREVGGSELVEDNKNSLVESPQIPVHNQVLLDLLNSNSPKHSISLTFLSDEEEELEEGELADMEDTEQALGQEDEQDIDIEEARDDISIENLSIKDNEPEFTIDSQGDEALVSRFEIPKPPKMQYITESRPQAIPAPDPNAGLEYDPVLNIGKVSLRTARDSNGNTTTELPAKSKKLKGLVEEQDLDIISDGDLSENDMGGYKDYIKQIMKQMSDEDSYESETNFDIMASSSEDEDEEFEEEVEEEVEAEPEYGFLPEDFEFDVSKITVTNVRFGILNQYYTKNLELTGSLDEFCWVDEDELFDYVIANGVKEHRLRSFLKYVTNGLIEQEFQEQPNYSDVYISETSDEEEAEEEDNGDDLDELIAFTKRQQENNITLDDIDATRSVRTKGKGRKKQLDLDRMDMDTDLLESLQEQYQLLRNKKKTKSKDKEDARVEAGLRRNDLLVKYPYTLHIKEIRDEFEHFLQDGSRNDMSFPPLDPHGNKTITKMARFYNMKASTCGNKGLKLFIKVTKHRKTFHYLPKYNDISHILGQRPVFNRTDQKRPRGEITATDGNAAKDRSRGRNKAGVTIHKEGDIVGGQAPEIGHDNIGRQLLEKLGWVKGEGLGALGNNGISEPVLAKIKKSKTGLK